MSASAPGIIGISIVEDDQQTREILSDVVRIFPLLRLVSGYGEPEAALTQLPRDRPDVVLMDINLPRVSGVECVRRLSPQLPQTQFLMLTVYEDTDHIFNALAAGATGYLLKSTRKEDLIAAIQQIHRGGSPMSSGIARKVVRSFAGAPQAGAGTGALSAREQDVLKLLAQGFLYKEIADSLGLSIPTVSTYVRRIYEKLQVHSRSQAAARYFGRPG